MIDKKLQHSIKQLNDKKYTTETCCSGHYISQYKTFALYISFKNYIHLNSFPKGWKNRKDNYIYATFNAKNETEFNKKQTEKINNLNTWIKGL